MRDLISNRRAVFVPQEIENVSLFQPDFLINIEDEDQLSLIEVNLESNFASVTNSTTAKKGISVQDEDLDNLPAER